MTATAHTAGVRASGQRILVVDDEPSIVDAVATAFRYEGYDVEEARTGREALEAVAREEPDLIILDWMLPDIAGIDVGRRVRERGFKSAILFLTAKDATENKVEALRAGGDDYVTKPFSLRELSARIRALFRRSEQAVALEAPPGVVDLDRVQVDLAGHRLLRDGETLPIKPKAFELLTFLIRHPGQVFTRDQLLERVWGYDYAGETRTVDVHIHWLRSQVEVDPSVPRFIHTVRGVGYVFRRPA